MVDQSVTDAFVLAGGQSTRMGRDKALLEIDGRPLLEHMLELLRGLGLNPRICGSRPDLARFAEVVPDNFPQCGPLGGIEAVLAVSDTDLNLFVPVDLPGLPREFLRWIMARAERSHAVATIPRFGDRPQPLCAVYSRRLRHGRERFLLAGNSKVMTAVREAAASLGEGVDEFDVESVASTLAPSEWPSNPPIAAWFRNVNTPAEYESQCAAAGAKRRHPISSKQKG
jgi:molybdopterin-guanine dinucleotide biosynthesis protein A